MISLLAIRIYFSPQIHFATCLTESPVHGRTSLVFSAVRCFLRFSNVSIIKKGHKHTAADQVARYCDTDKARTLRHCEIIANEVRRKHFGGTSNRVMEPTQADHKRYNVDRSKLADIRRCRNDQPGSQRHQPTGQQHAYNQRRQFLAPEKRRATRN